MLEEKTIYELKAKLIEEKERIEKTLSNKDGSSLALDREYQTKFEEIDRDEEENADEIEMYEGKIAADESMKQELKKIEAALKRIENGTYGHCSNCNREIPIERLKVYPQAQFCLECKNK